VAFKDLHVSQAIKITQLLSHQRSQGPGLGLQREIYTVFFCLSAGSFNKEMRSNSRFMLGEGEPNFKEFLASLAMPFKVSF
jgi:hypothetical protein